MLTPFPWEAGTVRRLGRTMKLLHLITRLSLGGSARNTIDSAAASARAGYDTILATGPSGDEIDVAHLAGGSGCRLEVIPSLRREVAPLADLGALVAIVRLIRREKVAIVHTHTSKAGFLGRLAARLANVPVVIHTPHGHIFYAYYGRVLTSFFVALERWSAKLSDVLVALTEDEMREHLERRIGRREQFRVVPSGVDLVAFRNHAPGRDEARSELGWSRHERILVGVGRLVPVKGFDVAVRALTPLCRSFPEIRLVLVGDGPERDRIERIAAASGNLSRLTITGATADVARFVAAADILVAPSRNEGMGRVLVEAMALGKPVVASRVGGIPSVVSHGRSGTLVPPDRPDELAAAVIQLLSEPGRMQAYSEVARELAERFSLPSMQQALLTLYDELATGKGLPPILAAGETKTPAAAQATRASVLTTPR